MFIIFLSYTVCNLSQSYFGTLLFYFILLILCFSITNSVFQSLFNFQVILFQLYLVINYFLSTYYYTLSFITIITFTIIIFIYPLFPLSYLTLSLSTLTKTHKTH